ncbi:MAG TPA: hypothetical protein VK589_20085 [Chryseolinea sp.]|nr:hypothetical protein [Chryseolinea sp.]
MDKIDQVLAKALDAAIVRQGGKNAVIARRLREKSYEFTPQGIGHYRRGKRAIPLKFIQGWREVFEEDLEKLAKNVSHETKSKQPLTFNPIDKLVSTLEMDKAKQQEEIIWQRKLIDTIVVRMCDRNDSSIEKEPPITNGK